VSTDTLLDVPLEKISETLGDIFFSACVKPD